MWVVQQEGEFWAEDEEMGGQDDRDKKAFCMSYSVRGFRLNIYKLQYKIIVL